MTDHLHSIWPGRASHRAVSRHIDTGRPEKKQSCSTPRSSTIAACPCCACAALAEPGQRFRRHEACRMLSKMENACSQIERPRSQSRCEGAAVASHWPRHALPAEPSTGRATVDCCNALPPIPKEPMTCSPGSRVMPPCKTALMSLSPMARPVSTSFRDAVRAGSHARHSMRSTCPRPAAP